MGQDVEYYSVVKKNKTVFLRIIFLCFKYTCKSQVYSNPFQKKSNQIFFHLQPQKITKNQNTHQSNHKNDPINQFHHICINSTSR